MDLSWDYNINLWWRVWLGVVSIANAVIDSKPKSGTMGANWLLKKIIEVGMSMSLYTWLLILTFHFVECKVDFADTCLLNSVSWNDDIESRKGSWMAILMGSLTETVLMWLSRSSSPSLNSWLCGGKVW